MMGKNALILFYKQKYIKNNIGYRHFGVEGHNASSTVGCIGCVI
jgi:hypothetical protein